MYLLLRVILDRSGEATALSLACAVVPFQIVMFSFISALSAVSMREPILLNMAFDRVLIPPASVLTEALVFAASFIMFPLAMLFDGVGPQLSLLWLPVVIAVTILLAFGAGAWPAALIGLGAVPGRASARPAGPADPVLRLTRLWRSRRSPTRSSAGSSSTR